MASQRKSYQQLDAEIQALIQKKNALLEGSAELFCKSILTKEVKAKIAELPNDDIRVVAKKVAVTLDDIIKSIKSKADDKDALRPYSAKTAPKGETTKQGIDLSSVVIKSATASHPAGVAPAGTGTAIQHHT